MSLGQSGEDQEIGSAEKIKARNEEADDKKLNGDQRKGVGEAKDALACHAPRNGS